MVRNFVSLRLATSRPIRHALHMDTNPHTMFPPTPINPCGPKLNEFDATEVHSVEKNTKISSKKYYIHIFYTINT